MPSHAGFNPSHSPHVCLETQTAPLVEGSSLHTNDKEDREREGKRVWNCQGLISSIELSLSLFSNISFSTNCIQWNLSIVNTLGTQLSVLYREVSLIQK